MSLALVVSESDAAVELHYGQFDATKPFGGTPQDLWRARTIAIALDDGAFLAVEALHRDRLLLEWAGDLPVVRHAHRVAGPNYADIRDYLHEYGFHYTVACGIALEHTRKRVNAPNAQRPYTRFACASSR